MDGCGKAPYAIVAAAKVVVCRKTDGRALCRRSIVSPIRVIFVAPKSASRSFPSFITDHGWLACGNGPSRYPPPVTDNAASRNIGIVGRVSSSHNGPVERGVLTRNLATNHFQCYLLVAKRFATAI